MAICDLSLYSRPGKWVQSLSFLTFEKSQGLTSQLGGLELMSQAGRWPQSPDLFRSRSFQSTKLVQRVVWWWVVAEKQHSRRGEGNKPGRRHRQCLGVLGVGGTSGPVNPILCSWLAQPWPSATLHTLGEISVPRMVWVSFLPGFASPYIMESQWGWRGGWWSL